MRQDRRWASYKKFAKQRLLPDGNLRIDDIIATLPKDEGESELILLALTMGQLLIEKDKRRMATEYRWVRMRSCIF